MSYRELKREVKLLRIQMAELKEKCEQREDRMFRVIEMMSPYFEAMPKEYQEAFMQRIEGADHD